MKIIFIIIFFWIIFQINKFIKEIYITNKNNKKNKIMNPKSKMDIQDADYEELE